MKKTALGGKKKNKKQKKHSHPPPPRQGKAECRRRKQARKKKERRKGCRLYENKEESGEGEDLQYQIIDSGFRYHIHAFITGKETPSIQKKKKKARILNNSQNPGPEISRGKNYLSSSMACLARRFMAGV